MLKVGESSGATGADFHVEGHCTDFPNDIRFTDNDETTLLDHWVEKTEGTTPNRVAYFWVEVQDDLSSSDVNIYIYYGKSGESSASNGDNTFLFFDDFEDGVLDADKWYDNAGGTVSEANGILTVTGGSAAWQLVGGKTQSFGVAVEAEINVTESERWYFGLDDRSATGSYIGSGTDQATFAYPSSTLGKKYRTSTEGTVTDTARTSDLSAWTRVWIKQKTGQVIFYDGAETTVTSNTPTDNMGITFWAYGSATSIEAKWVAMRKYVDPEPAFSSAGNEETETVTGQPYISRVQHVQGMHTWIR